MKTRSKQSGMSALGILAILIMVGFFAMCIIKMSPAYFESLSIRDIIERIVLDPETPESSIGDIRRDISVIFNTNQIYELDPRQVQIYRRDGKMYIDASYEVRVPLFWRFDGIIRFDDLKYQVGVAEPLDPEQAKKPK